MATPPDLTPEQIFLAHLEHIDRVIAYCSRQLSTEDAKDFGQHVKLKLIEDDYGVIRKFRGERGATLKTFLTTTINHSLLDYRDHLWGKHHASAEAKRLGDVGLRLERLMVRDRYSFEEACEILRTNEKVKMSVAELTDLRAKLPHRVHRQDVGEGPLEFEDAPELPPDQASLERERELGRRRLYMKLKLALDTLPTDDHLLVTLWLRFSLAEIARIRRIEQKPLYRRMGKIFKALRKALGHQGVRRDEIKELLGSSEKNRYAQPKRNNG